MLSMVLGDDYALPPKVIWIIGRVDLQPNPAAGVVRGISSLIG